MDNINSIDIKSIIKGMRFFNMVDQKINIHIPDSERYLKQVMSYFIGEHFVWLPEYEQVAEWLDDNKGLGLCLYGNNGTGKTILIQKAIPLLLFRFCSKVVRCFNYYELQTNVDVINYLRLLSIDDVGLEAESVIWGNKRWIFPEIMDMAEKRDNVIIFSSNLDAKGFITKYGIRTFERIVSTTKRVEFKHLSLRK